VTHFVAPAFIFLAGTSAFFYGRKHSDLSRFLLVRGVWLVLLELTVIRVAWTFNLDFANYLLAGVIWVIGWCMILMAALVRLRVRTIAIIGLAIITLHNALLPPLISAVPALGDLWKVLYIGFFNGPVGGTSLIVLYSIVPWIGVMAAGYAFGAVLTMEPARRNRIGVRIGVGAIALFLVLRGTNLYGDPRPWSATTPLPALLSFLNATKYPASLSFLLMTLGPTIALIPLLNRARGRIANWLAIFGRVPFFYYVLHIPLIHALALLVSNIRLGEVSPWLFTNHPDGESAGPGRLHLESGTALSRLGGRGPVALLPLPLVRRSQGAAPGLVAEVPLREDLQHEKPEPDRAPRHPATARGVYTSAPGLPIRRPNEPPSWSGLARGPGCRGRPPPTLRPTEG
jgi:uncharacterized membrane protein